MATDEDLRGFFAQHDARLCRLGFLLTGDPAQAEELAQDALVRTWRRWQLVGRPDNPGTYARKVLVNRHRSLLRRALVEARYRYRDRLDARSGDEHREDAIVLWAATVGCHRANRPCWCCATTRTSARPAFGLGRWLADPSACPPTPTGSWPPSTSCRGPRLRPRSRRRHRPGPGLHGDRRHAANPAAGGGARRA